MQNLLLDKSSVIKTETYKENIKLYVEEGLKWMHQKFVAIHIWPSHQLIE